MQQESLAHPPTREQRGIRLYRNHGDEISYMDGVWYVPSQHDATSVFEVVLGPHESCECADFEYRVYACKHIYAAAVAKAKTAPCAGCGTRHKHRDLAEVPDDHLTFFDGDLICPACATGHGVL